MHFTTGTNNVTEPNSTNTLSVTTTLRRQTHCKTLWLVEPDWPAGVAERAAQSLEGRQTGCQPIIQPASHPAIKPASKQCDSIMSSASDNNVASS